MEILNRENTKNNATEYMFG